MFEKLAITTEEKYKLDKEAVLSEIRKGHTVYMSYDTETTGVEPYPKMNSNGDLENRDRVIEVGFLFYISNNQGQLVPLLNKNGEQVQLHEYINPALEGKDNLEFFKSKATSDPDALQVHGISDQFLNGKGSLGGLTLKKPAPSFKYVAPLIEDMLCVNEIRDEGLKGGIVGFAHNASFDIGFLNMEMRHYYRNERPDIYPPMEFDSMIRDTWDTMKLMSDLYSRDELHHLNDLNPFKLNDAFGNPMNPGYSMSYLAHILGVKEVGREDFHGALLDAKILADCFNGLLQTDKYKLSLNKLPIPAPVVDFIGKKINNDYSLPAVTSKIQPKSEDYSGVLNIIKTDASLHEGTGNIKEFVERAKELGIKELVMSDNLTLLNGVEFYQSCLKNDINPRIGTNLKIEAESDKTFLMNKNRKLIGFLEDTFTENESSMGNNTGDSVKPNLIERLYKLERAKNISDFLELGVACFDGVRKGQKTAALNKRIKDFGGMLDSIGLGHISLEEKLKESGYCPRVVPYSNVTDVADLTLIGINNTGYDNIKKIITYTHQKSGGVKTDKGEYHTIAIEDIPVDMTEGVLALVGDSGDIVGRSLKIQDFSGADKSIEKLKEKFGNRIAADINLKVYQMGEAYKKNEEALAVRVAEFANKHNLKTIATQHAAFAKPEDYALHREKESILLDRRLDDLSFVPSTYASQFLLSPDASEKLFANNKHLLMNTEDLKKAMSLEMEIGKPKLPKFPTPNGEDEVEYFKHVVKEGFEVVVDAAFLKHCKSENLDPENQEIKNKFFKSYQDRLDYEMEVIIDMGFPGYFLIKQDMVNFCRENKIPLGAGRGSAAGSLVVHSLGITSIDPVEHGLFFERFLNPERKEMPDIDTDISGSGRELVLTHLNKRYGALGQGFPAAAYIITKSTFSAKSTIKAVSKAHQKSVGWQNELSDLIPNIPGVTIEESLQMNDDLMSRYETEPSTKQIIDMSISMEKLTRATGKHAGGIVVGDLVSLTSLEFDESVPVVQYDKDDIETVGGVKFDLLGLGTLEVLSAAIDNVVRDKGLEALEEFGITIDDHGSANFLNLNYNDKKTYDTLAAGLSSNVFQVESDGMKELLKRIKVSNIEEVAALVALYRPGPLESGMVEDYINGKNDPKTIHYEHEVLKPILENTYGAILYQEQVMDIAKSMAGYTLGGADKLRKAMGKKDPTVMKEQREIFINGAKNNGYDEELAMHIFDKMEKFAGYGFNKSHAVCYADLTYKTALLKTHFPEQYMSAVLTNAALSGDAVNKVSNAYASAREFGVHVLQPDINTSKDWFTVEVLKNKNGDDTEVVRYGLSAIKGLTSNSLAGLIAERDKNGPYKNILDIMLRNRASNAGKSIMEGLINSGALDGIPLVDNYKPKTQLDNAIEKRALKRLLLFREYSVLAEEIKTQKKKDEYKKSPWEINYNYHDIDNFFSTRKNQQTKIALAREFDSIHAYVSGHPLNINNLGYRLQNDPTFVVNSTDVRDALNPENFKEKEWLRVAGVIKDVELNAKSNAGNTFGVVTLNDGTGDFRVFMFSDAISDLKDGLDNNGISELKIGDTVSVVGAYSTYTNKAGKEEKRFGASYFGYHGDTDIEVKINPRAKDYTRKVRMNYNNF